MKVSADKRAARGRTLSKTLNYGVRPHKTVAAAGKRFDRMAHVIGKVDVATLGAEDRAVYDAARWRYAKTCTRLHRNPAALAALKLAAPSRPGNRTLPRRRGAGRPRVVRLCANGPPSGDSDSDSESDPPPPAPARGLIPRTRAPPCRAARPMPMGRDGALMPPSRLPI